ncbi:MAG TPA: peptide ligase PGM1-related protein [Thermoanaerobaculia bacterium]
MIPKPPFSCDLSPERELEEFRRIQPRLAELWNLLSNREEQPYTSVVIPSLTLDQRELEKLEGASHYEERLLFLLIRLRNPQARMVYVTSRPVHPLILDYYFELLAGIPASHARSRLTLLCAYDTSPRSLTEKILERPRLIQRIRYGIGDPTRAFLTVYNSTPLERRLAVLLGIPLNGVDPDLQSLGTKSGSRRAFREAGVAMPDGFEGLRSKSDLVEALDGLRRRQPAIRKAVVKLDDSFSGEGNAIFRYPGESDRTALEDALSRLSCAVSSESADSYLEKFRTMGGIVEEFLDGNEARSPSCQIRIDPSGKVVLISTHDQLLGGPTGQLYLGCRFPADDGYRRQIQDAGRRVGEVLAARGVVSRLAIDFVVRRGPGSTEWKPFAIEINLRVGGTTHPFLALEFLTGGQLDPETGLFHSPSGLAKYYRSTDNLKSDAYRGLSPEDLLDITTINHLHYSHGTETGVLFHMIGAVSQFGKLGITVIGNSHEQVNVVYQRAIAVLDRETEYGRHSTRAQEEVAEPPAEARSGRPEYRDTIVVPRVWPADS